MKILSLFFCIVLFATGCNSKPSSPAIGPNGSWWVGGADGGVFVYIEDDENKNDNIYQGTIYYEHDKSIWYQGKFKYSKNTGFDFENKSLYDGWDGEKLFLTDDSFLSAVNPPD